MANRGDDGTWAIVKSNHTVEGIVRLIASRQDAHHPIPPSAALTIRTAVATGLPHKGERRPKLPSHALYDFVFKRPREGTIDEREEL